VLTAPPADAATRHAPPLLARVSGTPTAPAEAAGGGGKTLRFASHQARPVLNVEPHGGYMLIEVDDWDGEGFRSPTYAARSMREDRLLNVSRFFFTPTSERFAWLVDNGFPPAPSIGPWCDAQIDAAIAAEARRSAA